MLRRYRIALIMHSDDNLCMHLLAPVARSWSVPASAPGSPSIATPWSCGCRSEARVGSRQYAPAYLLVPRQEVEEGLGAHYNCPQSLSEWLKKEGGLGTTAGHFLS